MMMQLKRRDFLNIATGAAIGTLANPATASAQVLQQPEKTIMVAITHFTAGQTTILKKVLICTSEGQALNLINQEADAWNRQGQAIAAECGGEWSLDDIYQKPFFMHLGYGAQITANSGEEIFNAVIDEESQQRLYAEHVKAKGWTPYP